MNNVFLAIRRTTRWSERITMRNIVRKLSVVPACRAINAPAGLKELAMRDIVAIRQFF